jgi:hypothetical protein
MFVYVANVQVFDRKTLTFSASQSTFGGVFNETLLRSWQTLIGLLKMLTFSGQKRERL